MEKRLAKVFVIYDSKAEVYSKSPFVLNRADALRGFEQEVNGRSDSQIAKYPADFTLFEIGVYDELTGSVIMHEAKISLGNGAEFVKGSETTSKE